MRQWGLANKDVFNGFAWQERGAIFTTYLRWKDKDWLVWWQTTIAEKEPFLFRTYSECNEHWRQHTHCGISESARLVGEEVAGV